jgi:glutathione S-transferase
MAKTMIYVTSTRCNICQSPLRDEVDKMLLGETLQAGGVRYRYEDIVPYLFERGLTTSTGALSRHRNNHLQPALEAALETQAVIDAISSATGKKLSLHSAVVNIISAKAIRALDNLDFKDLDQNKMLTAITRAAEVAIKLEKAEAQLSTKQVEAVQEKLTKAGLEPGVIEQIKRELYGIG